MRATSIAMVVMAATLATGCGDKALDAKVMAMFGAAGDEAALEKKARVMKYCKKKIEKRVEKLSARLCKNSASKYYEALRSDEFKRLIRRQFSNNSKPASQATINGDIQNITWEAYVAARNKYREDYPKKYKECTKERRGKKAKRGRRGGKRRQLENGKIPGYSDCLARFGRNASTRHARVCCREVGGRFLPRGRSGRSPWPTCLR